MSEGTRISNAFIDDSQLEGVEYIKELGYVGSEALASLPFDPRKCVGDGGAIRNGKTQNGLKWTTTEY
ncbi:hypothetical protein [Clostridium perfringens]|uniref:hypothetical protein n=1 Tax=Clostridium perfringens TaxID=1502 RepID=UPI00244A74C7|nr:hypothetical protein [Clostridium perfringens]MDH2474267.1 hypothetical protein [Clostridium perfringens]